jgi:hypothetical protein
MNLRKMLDTIVAYRAGAPLATSSSEARRALRTSRDVVRKLEPCTATTRRRPTIAELRALPPGTLGREYARHLDANGIVAARDQPGT